MDNAYNNPNGYKSQPDSGTKTALVVTSLVALFVLAGLLMILPERTMDPTVSSMVEPSAGEELSGGITTPLTTNGQVAVPGVITSYASQEACEQATRRTCHYLSCEGGMDYTCSPASAGWQAVVPTPDRTAIPERIAPPLGSAGDTITP